MGLDRYRNSETFRLGWTLASPPVPSSSSKQPRLGVPILVFNQVWKTSSDRGSTTSLGNQAKRSKLCFTCREILLLIHSANPCLSLWPLSLILPPQKRVWLYHLYLHQPVFPWIKLLSLSEDRSSFTFLSAFKGFPYLHYPSKPSFLNIHHLVPETCVSFLRTPLTEGSEHFC